MPGSTAALSMAFQRRMSNRQGPYAALAAPQQGGMQTPTFGNGTPLQIRVYLALGADLTGDSSTWTWTDVSSYVRYDSGITVSYGRADESSTVDSGTLRLTFDNRDGRFSRKNPNSPYYGQLARNTPIKVEVNAGSSDYGLAYMYVNEWPARWDTSAVDFTVPISAAGIMRRLNQGETIDLSALRSTIGSGFYCVAYYPLEDSANATQAEEVIENMAATITPPFGFTEASAAELYGSSALAKPHISSDANVRVSHIDGVLPDWPWWWNPATNYWSASWFINIPVKPATIETIMLEPYTTDQVLAHMQVVLGTDGKIRLRSINSGGVDEFSDAGTTFDQFTTNGSIYGRWCYFTLGYTVSGSTSTFTVTWSDAVQSFSSSNTYGTGPSGNHVVNQAPSNFRISSASNSADEFGLGHIAFYSTSPVPVDVSVGFGYDGEDAVTRMYRICLEEGIPFALDGDFNATHAAMGPQTSGTALSILRDCETADGGTLYEYGFGLAYQTRAARYNRVPDFTLDVASGPVSDLEPTDDDQHLRNELTVSRSRGTSITLSDAGSITTNGLYTESKTLNLAADSQVQDACSWLLHIGSQDDLRWPAVTVNLASPEGAAFIDKWINRTVYQGLRLSIANPPTKVTADPIDVFLEGVTETVDPYTWTVDMSTSPGAVDNIFRIQGTASLGRSSNVGRMAFGGGQSLAAGIATGDTSLSIATVSGAALVTTSAADFPQDWVIDGERITVTAVTGSSSPQTATVVRSVNGVVKAHAAGASIELYQPGVIAR